MHQRSNPFLFHSKDLFNFNLPESCGDIVGDETVDSVVTPGNQQHDHTNNAREEGYPVKKEKSSW